MGLSRGQLLTARGNGLWFTRRVAAGIVRDALTRTPLAMSSRNLILQAIYRAVDEINRQLPRDQRLGKEPETVLVGPEARLDSLGLINLIVTTEQHVQGALGQSVILTDVAVLENPEATLGLAETAPLTCDSARNE